MSSVNSTASCMQVNDLKKSRTLTDMKQEQAEEDEEKEIPTIFAVKPRPPAQVTGCPFFVESC